MAHKHPDCEIYDWPVITEEQFEQELSRWSFTRSLATREAMRLCLVERMDTREAAQRTGTHNSNIRKAIRRFISRMSDPLPPWARTDAIKISLRLPKTGDWIQRAQELERQAWAPQDLSFLE